MIVKCFDGSFQRELRVGPLTGYDRRGPIFLTVLHGSFIRSAVTFSGRLAQLVRALCSHRRGHWFESSVAHLSVAQVVAV